MVQHIKIRIWRGGIMAFCTEIICDACASCITIGTIATKGSMVRTARKQGWSIGKYALCPECKKKRKQLIKDGWLK